MTKILLLHDYRHQFWLKTNYREQSVDLISLKDELRSFGHDAYIKGYSDIDFRETSYEGHYVFYQSSEDPGLFYKDFIEDILLGLKLQGAKLVPAFEYFRAHHNKVFAEVLRQLYCPDDLMTPKTRWFGTYEDYKNSGTVDFGGQHVFKLAAGAQSKNVHLLTTKSEHLRLPRNKSRSFSWHYWIVDQVKPFLRSCYPKYKPKSHHRKKFVVQEFVPNLTGDYKVLVFANKVFVLTRKSKRSDFRASGSGLFSYDKNVPRSVLDFSERVFTCFDTPFMALDVAFTEGRPFLFEFQFVHFGTYTAEKAPHYFEKTNSGWQAVAARVQIEREYARCINAFVGRSAG